MLNFKNSFYVTLFSLFSCFIFNSTLESYELDRSFLGRYPEYRKVCLQAAEYSRYFKNFRSHRGLIDTPLEGNPDIGWPFVNYIVSNPHLMEKMPFFKKADRIGNPIKFNYTGIGEASPNLLRYIVIADHLNRLFDLKKIKSIVEIGGGLGEQCFTLSAFCPFKKYTILDLPESRAIIDRVLYFLSVRNARCKDLHELNEKSFDLVISNFGVSYHDKPDQLIYLEKVISKAKRGYIIYAELPSRFGVSAFTLDEFIEELKSYGIHPKVSLSPVTHGYPLITWGI